MATCQRSVTQPMAQAIFEEGAAGFACWSTIEAAWTNVTLLSPRAIEHLALSGEPEVLSVRHPVLRAAADALGVRLS